MSKIPFKKFIITFLFFNKSISFIIEKLKAFGYYIKEDEVKEIFDEIRTILPESITELLNAGIPLDLKNEIHVQWLKELGVFEYYDYIIRRDIEKSNPPEYFKWCADCIWVHSYKDVMSLINILMFNEEPLDEISNIVMYKYRKKIGIDALQLYKRIFWDTDVLTAKEALYHCEPFRNNALIIRKLRSGNTEVTSMDDDEDDGSDVPFTFHNNDYIKWKIGYRDIPVPSAKDFIEKIKTDSYYKMYEAMNMTQSVEMETEDGTNDEFGSFTKTTVKKRNVEEQRAKLVKHWMDIYLKANEAMPSTGGDKDKDFFTKMQQLELDFEDVEKIVSVNDVPDMLNDIKSDMSL